MAYQTYITEALVCGSYDNQTADRSFLLFTREAGMLFAYAKSIREERSKHRYALQDCSHVRVTLVRGKAGWRITGSEPIANLYTHMETRDARAVLRNLVLLLRRVIHGETAHAHVFDDVVAVLREAPRYPGKRLERILVLRILHALGYVAPEVRFRDMLHGPFPYEALETLSAADETVCEEIIQRALLESHL